MHNAHSLEAFGDGVNPKRSAAGGRDIEAHQPKLIQSVERALSMLEEIAASDVPPSASELASSAGVNRATAWRLLTTLEHFHLVERDQRSGRYSVGYGASRLAAASGDGPLIRRARPVLERLGKELDERVYLQVFSGDTMVVLDEIHGSHPVQVDITRIDAPLHCKSVGKLYLAFLPDNEREEYLAQPRERYTERTIVDSERLRAELTRVRANRYAMAYQEGRPDWSGISSVVCDRADRPLAYLNVTVPSYRYTEDALHELSTPMLAAAADLQRRLLPHHPATAATSPERDNSGR